MKNGKKLISIILLLLVIAAGTGGWYYYNLQGADDLVPETLELKTTDLTDSILVSGFVKSSNSRQVYSLGTGQIIDSVKVEVGSRVKAGEILAVMNTEQLELDIKQTELTITNAQATLNNEISANAYSEQTQANNLIIAEIDLANAQKNVDQTKELYEAGISTLNELTTLEYALEKAKVAYSAAQNAFENAENKSTTVSRNSIELQKITLEKLQKTLEDSVVLAPIDGMITIVNAKESVTSNGLLFIIEDTENLIVSSQIGEYDVNLIHLGQEVIVKTDSTGDQEFMGYISNIAPVAQKDSAGNTVASSNVQFNTEITLKEYNPAIKIGMNARLNIIIDEKKGVFSVPYNTVVVDENGNSCIFVLDEIQNENEIQTVIRKIVVQTGMSTDMLVEIISPELKEGMNILVNPEHDAHQ